MSSNGGYPLGALIIPVTNISKCCRGKRRIAGGFVWKYKEDD